MVVVFVDLQKQTCHQLKESVLLVGFLLESQKRAPVSLLIAADR